MDRVDVNSESIRSVGYDAQASTLELEFSSGRIYQFLDVPPGVHDWLMRVPAKGAYFNRQIRDIYDFRDVTPAIEGPSLLDVLRESLARLGERPRHEP